VTDTKKIQSAVAYLAAKLSPGKVKLFKLLYLADFTAYAEIGHSITGDTYENFEMGPVPVTLWKQFDDITNECVTLDLVETDGLPEQQMRSRQDFHPELDEKERLVLDKIIQRFGDWTGGQLREYTHKTIPYLATQRRDTIPYGLAAYLNYQKPSRARVDELLKDKQLMRRLAEGVRFAGLSE
jgi:uncharacterized phage-associated protein